MGVEKLLLCVYRAIVWHLRSKECLGKSVYHVTCYTIHSPFEHCVQAHLLSFIREVVLTRAICDRLHVTTKTIPC